MTQKKPIVEQLTTWGKEGNTATIPQVEAFAYDDDERIRAACAVAFGEIIAQKTVNDEVKRAIEHLGVLTRDRAPLVRQCAVTALGKIRSEAVIPSLTQALQDPDLEIVATASAILQHYKTYSASPPQSSPQPLPANTTLKSQSHS
ncbi:HEAT repeat domain-containing protein [Halothece sp. PCC 7418]|uniref:HEAT repeat domain-containing protein n=1 Tax=Halothece sp. (strain PCC 7418) TaxID=65093 RepID=UPI0002F624CE|nr:HEAT repeat domain-containing protein [Halothece sp. PCC 7418]